MEPDWLDYRDILRCPTCQSELTETTDALRCGSCEVVYPISEGQPDLRIQEPVSKETRFQFDGNQLNPSDFSFNLTEESNPEVDWSDTDVPHHLDEAVLSHFPKAESQQEYALDAGCGDGVHEQICQKAGFNWVGVDIQSERSPVLGDVHSLPFDDSMFDFCISIAVLEHVSNPFVFLNEINRVLKPESKFIGTVAFLEPFHANSYYHHSPLGTIHTLREAGFTVEEVGVGWHSLTAIGRRLFPKLPDKILSIGTVPIDIAHRIWYRIGRALYDDYEASKQYQRIGLAGSFRFIASS
jgi:SAM-dependent methyltransferase/uncharacterized protein YbaR (Trm112 family)